MVVADLLPRGVATQFFTALLENGASEQGARMSAMDNATRNAGEMITNNHEDWVSATQTTNGVAGDTIQKGELLTLRFFLSGPAYDAPRPARLSAPSGRSTIPNVPSAA